MVLLSKRLGELIIKRRIQCGYSQQQVAEAAKLSRSFYSEIECGKRNVSIVTLYRLAAALKTTGQIFLHQLESEIPLPDPERHLEVVDFLLAEHPASKGEGPDFSSGPC